MRYSANLNIIIKAIEKATDHVPRDFSELENLQTNPASAIKFANACYSRIKEILIDDLTKFRPEYNIYFSDGEKIIRKDDAEYSFTIFVVDGLSSLVRGIPDFTVAVAIEHLSADGTKESISLAINKVIGGELYYCEKGFGAYLNNRRLRVSKRGLSDVPLVSLDDNSYFTKEVREELKLKSYGLRNYGCRTLEIAYLSSARFDLAFFKNWNYEYLKPFLLLVREAGGKVAENDKFILASNGLINFSS